jgi:hypothetical protein
MHSSRLAAVFAAGALAIAGLATGTAHASAPFTDTVRVSGNLDQGDHGYWARLAYSRTVSINPAGDGVWAVALRDVGRFDTIRGARSPQAGAVLGRPATGSFAGTYNFTVHSEAKPSDALVRRGYDFRCNPAVPNRGDCAGMPKTTGEWPALYFPAGAQVTAGSWRWEYRTCSETWVNSSAGNRGDITGERCERAVRPQSPTAVQPECDAERGSLTIPSQRGVRYEVRVNDARPRAVEAGTYPAKPAVYRVTAHAVRGYELRGDRVWRRVVEQAEPCPTPTPTVTVTPTVDPTPDPEPTPTETVTEEPEPTPTVTQTVTDKRTVIVRDYLPVRIDTGLGGLAK